ncbi:twitchin-like, partial [Tropilaelaps mercedesae]
PYNVVKMSKEPVAPTFLHKPILRQEDDGNRLVFECELIANPRPMVTESNTWVQWFRNEHEVLDTQRTEYKILEKAPGKYYIALAIDDVYEPDKGLYTVFAKNHLGDVSSSINLNFLRKYS